MLRKQQDQDELARDGWGSAAGDGSRTRTSSRVMDGDRPQATAAEEDVLTRMDAAEAAGRTTKPPYSPRSQSRVGMGIGGGGWVGKGKLKKHNSRTTTRQSHQNSEGNFVISPTTRSTGIASTHPIPTLPKRCKYDDCVHCVTGQWARADGVGPWMDCRVGLICQLGF
ncbi:hypothetical protein OsJ_19514 [Oryza sativa Japonica Group]|uniref:Uncharacterized protein n=1 Tax=Oryza sativa subsp. japonica TaxID=39947 RepID=B9FLK5_ORYSJ|nr:hypothetical protein OsJ_19514 [Oryza sativa Japonica Group]